MNIFFFLFNEILYRPIFNILMFFLATFEGNLALAIVVLTLVIRLVLVSMVGSPQKMQDSMGGFQSDTQEIQEKYKDDPQKLSEEMMNLMKKKGGGPLKGCLGMVVQAIVMLGLLGVLYTISSALGGDGSSRFSFSQSFPEQIYSFLYTYTQPYLSPGEDAIQTSVWGIDLLVSNNMWLTIAAAVFMYINMKIMAMVRPMKTPSVPGASMPDMGKMMKFMHIFFVLMMGIFVYNVAAGIGIYVVTTTVFSILQFFVTKRALLIAKFRAWKSNGQNIVVSG